MKKIFSIFCLIPVVFLFSSCDMPDYTDEINAAYFNAGGSSGTAVCTYGQYRCSDNDSYFCGYSGNDLLWLLSQKCSYGCDSSTGKCKSSNDSGNGSSSGSDSSSGSNSGSNSGSDSSSGSSSSSGSCSTIDGNMWSPKSSDYMTWDDAVSYCNNLTACGYSDWHLPTISELRTLIQNCSGTVTGGSCGVTDSCLYWWHDCKNDACYGCEDDNGSGKYSKLGDTDWLSGAWSSSIVSDNTEAAWHVQFRFGNVLYNYKINSTDYVYCVR